MYVVSYKCTRVDTLGSRLGPFAALTLFGVDSLFNFILALYKRFLFSKEDKILLHVSKVGGGPTVLLF
jgi:hypothetical protein